MDVSAPFEPSVVFPGDDVSDALPASGVVKLGVGLLLQPPSPAAGARAPPGGGAGEMVDEEGDGGGGGVLSTRAGFLERRLPNRFFVSSAARRYVASVGDTVVGVVGDRNADFYRVDVGGSVGATLPTLAFDGATRRNKPTLAVGTVVFARVAACGKHVDVELSCMVSEGPKRDWMTGQSVLGELRGGTLVRVPLAVARRLLDPDCVLLNALGEAVPFEVVVGVNGVVYVRAHSGAYVRSRVRWRERAQMLEGHLVPALASPSLVPRLD